MISEQTVGTRVPGQRGAGSLSEESSKMDDQKPDSSRRMALGIDADYSLHLRATLGRLCRELVESVEEGGPGLSEIVRLHAWLRADFVPWTSRRLDDVNLATRGALSDLMAQVGSLDARLVTTAGTEAAELADRMRRLGTDLVAELIKSD